MRPARCLAWLVLPCAFFLSGPLFAARIQPADIPFSATGPISFSKGLLKADCSITLSGRVAPDGSHARVERVSFGGDSYKCARVTATHLPWTLTPLDERNGAMSGIRVTVSAPLLGGECGPSTASGTWDNTLGRLSAVKVTLAGGCVIEKVAIQLTPAFRVLR